MERAGKGFSLLECMIVIAIAGILMGILVPNFRAVVQSYRRDGVAQQIAGDVRKARARAIATGWQYRIVGFNAEAASPYSNQYRLMARKSAAEAWPAVTAASMENATQMAGTWVDIPALYPGVRLNPNDLASNFSVAFNAGGVRVDNSNFDPLVIANEMGPAKSMSVSTVGNVGIE